MLRCTWYPLQIAQAAHWQDTGHQDAQLLTHGYVATGPTSMHSGQHTRYSFYHPQLQSTVVNTQDTKALTPQVQHSDVMQVNCTLALRPTRHTYTAPVRLILSLTHL